MSTRIAKKYKYFREVNNVFKKIAYFEVIRFWFFKIPYTQNDEIKSLTNTINAENVLSIS